MSNVQSYLNGLHRRDPLTQKMRQLDGAQIVEDHFPMERLSGTQFFRSFLQADDMFHGMNVFVPIAPTRTVDLRTWRSRKRDAFCGREKVLLSTKLTTCPAVYDVLTRLI